MRDAEYDQVVDFFHKLMLLTTLSSVHLVLFIKKLNI